jgi:stage II sporulation SpoAA-like protein
MPVEMKYEPNGICALRISGSLKRSEFGAEQNAIARKIDIESKPRLLVILENFEGWERGADWNDLDFLISHSGKISKIAIVGPATLGAPRDRFCRRRCPPRAGKVFSA